jgi:ankyrin repeat protein
MRLSKTRVNIVKILLDNGADVDCHDLDQKTPLYYAAKKQKNAIVQLLFGRGANKDVLFKLYM